MLKNKFNRIHFSSLKGEWNSPKDFFLFLHKKFKFTFDPCVPAIIGNFKGDGLRSKWTGRVYCNMEYNDIMSWLTWGWEQLCENNCELIAFLVPARIDTEWFHFLYVRNADFYKIKGRLKFNEHENSAPFPSILCVVTTDHVKQFWKRLGVI